MTPYQNKMISQSLHISNSTCCGTQAIISCYYEQHDFDISIFEIMTTVPFAITHNYAKTKRLIESFIDHDIGIPRAYNNLNIVYEKKYWQKNYNTNKIINLLKEAVRKQPVVLGPLNMDGLSYLYHGELYNKMNHYVIAMGYDKNIFYLTDTEGYPLVMIDEESLIDAWRGDRIIEGKGAFIMQNIIPKSLNHAKKQILETLRFAAINYKKALEQENCAGEALLRVYDMREIFKVNSTIQNRLAYDLPLRIQRNLLINKFVIIIGEQFKKISNYTYLIKKNIKSQNIYYANILQSILEKSEIDFTLFLKLANFENKLSNFIINLDRVLK